MKATFALLFIAVLSISFNPIKAQSRVNIEDITKNPDIYADEDVVFTGIVDQYIPESSNSRAHFLLKGKYGHILKINTNNSEAPKQNKTYEIEGLVVLSANRIPHIIAYSKRCLDCEAQTAVSSVEENSQTSNVSDGEFPIWWIFAGAAGLLVLILVLVLMKKKSNSANDSSMNDYSKSEGFTQEEYDQQDFKTIKLNLSDIPATVRFMPGKFIIADGPDAGKTFRLSGKKSVVGNIATIGREASSDNDASHLKLEDPTISKKQAEIREGQGKIYVKNLSSTNHTVLNGAALEVGEEKELSDGSSFSMGDINMKYALR